MNAIERFGLNEKVILITGGAGLYGRGLVRDIASAGARVVIASRNLAAGEDVAQAEQARGLKVVAEQFDQASEESIVALRTRVLEHFGRIDGLVNNSVARPMAGVDGSLAGWEESMKVNATGAFLMHRHFGEVMCRQKYGSIVNIGSIQGMVGPSLDLYGGTSLSVGAPDYFFHKGGMLNLTRYYAAVFGPHGVRVNCLAPGGLFSGQPGEFQRRYASQTFLGRLGDEQDLGGVVIFMLGEASRYITGVNLPVDGGYTAH